MKSSNVWIAFLLASTMAVIQSALFSHIVLLAYAPFIAIACIYAPFREAIWLAALSGFCSDLLASDPPGIHALCACLTCAIVHRYRRSFFKELSLQVCFYTALISAILSPMLLILLFLFDRPAPVAGKSILLDLVTMPFIDAAYAFFWFVGPLLLWEWGKKQFKLWKLKNNEPS